MTDISMVQCDSCEERVPSKNAQGWFKVMEVVTSQAQYMELIRQAEETGFSGAISGDFCSLTCIARWAMNAEKARRMEGGFE